MSINLPKKSKVLSRLGRHQTTMPIQTRSQQLHQTQQLAVEHKQLQQSVRQETSTIGQHLKRMIATAGHSWSTTEHDALFTPLQRVAASTTHFVPIRMRKTRQLTPDWMHSWQSTYFIILLLALVAIPASLALRNDVRTERYELSAATQKLVGEPITALDKQLFYNTKTTAYQYNPEAMNGIQPLTNGDNSSGKTIGGSKYYGVSLAKVAAYGQTYTDAQTKLSFSLEPQFGQLDGRHEAGHIVYPIDNGQVVYTLKGNGLKEDIILTQPTDTTSFSYKLKLPDSLEARLTPDGSIGIYSANPALFGNISYGSDKDQVAVEQARSKAQKTNLVFLIPAPVVVQSAGTHTRQTGTANFSLKGDVLTVTASNLSNLNYPISIDPSVVINSANSFSQGNNEDNNISFGANSISRGTTSGGVVNTIGADTSCGVANTWCSVQTGASGYNGTNGAREAATLAYNGFLYAIGGNYNNNSASINTVSYAPLNGSNGTVGSWTVGSSLVGGVALSGFGSAVYNGYLYVIGGSQQGGTASSVIQYALICTGQNAGQGGCTATSGSVGTWTQSTASTNFWTVDGTNYRAVFSAVAYNGFMYAIGGYNTNSRVWVTSVLYAPILANGDLGNWTTTASLPYTGSSTATVYNSNIYVGLACDVGNGATLNTCTATSNLLIGAISPSGGIMSWTVSPTTYTVFGTSATRLPSIVAVSGYLYVGGGYNGSSYVATVSYAPIYANGAIGSPSATSPFTSVHGQSMLTAYNGYLYAVGGRTNDSPPTDASDTQYAKIDAFNQANYISAGGGSTGVWGSAGTNATNLPTGAVMGQATVAYNGYIYLIGGCASFTFNIISGGTCSNISAKTYSVPICTGPNSNPGAGCGSSATAGSLGNWSAALTPLLPTPVYYTNAVVYNGYIYVVGGCTSGATCSTYTATTQIAQILPGGTLGSWSSGSFPAALGNIGLTAYNGYLYAAGGGISNTAATNAVYYAQILSGGSLGGWTPSSTFTTARAAPSLVAYNNYLYLMGGATGSGSGTAVTDVLYAPINPVTGSAGGWSSPGTLNSLPTATSAGFGWALDGFLYIAGGTNGTSSASNYLSTAYYAPINSNGTIGSWNTTSGGNSFSTGRAAFGAAVYNGYAYIMGGIIYNSVNYINTIKDAQFAPVQVQPMVAHYSRLIDLASTISGNAGGDPEITRYVIQGTSAITFAGLSGISMCISGATTSNVVFGTTTCTNNLTLPNTTTWKNLGRYAFIYVTIDESQNGTLAGPSPDTITELDLYFHAAPARRMRMGQTFTNMTSGSSNVVPGTTIPLTQVLDTEGAP